MTIVIAVAVYLVVLLLAYGLGKAAKRGDRMMGIDS